VLSLAKLPTALLLLGTPAGRTPTLVLRECVPTATTPLADGSLP
jgi:hypothetical protein